MTEPSVRAAEEGTPASDDGSGADLGRRRFFRQFAAELVQAAGQVVGAATVLQQSSAAAAGAILDPAGAAARLAGAGAGERPASTFRTAFRWDGDRLVLVDQRRLPAALVDHECRTAAEVAHAIRERIVDGAPAIGQVAAVGLALSAERLRASRPYARRATLRGSANALVNARPSSITVRRATGRMLARYEAIGDLSEDGEAIADGLRAEAEAIVFEWAAANGRIAELAAEELRALAATVGVGDGAERRLRILTIGSTGVLGGGQFGTALGAMTVAAHAGLGLHVLVAETRPTFTGARLTAWELAQAGLPHTVIADGAIGWILGQGQVDVVLVGSDRVAADGSLAAVTGTYPLAALAARHAVPFIACAPLACIDHDSPDGAALPGEDGPVGELLSFGETRLAPAESLAANPVLDITPPELVGAIVTEAGVLRQPLGPALAGLEMAVPSGAGPLAVAAD
ncbi:MAG TPA: s-methyl-5-thioribose-1-phosphate isomerase [Candidatus Limnocylindrales bacterium]